MRRAPTWRPPLAIRFPSTPTLFHPPQAAASAPPRRSISCPRGKGEKRGRIDEIEKQNDRLTWKEKKRREEVTKKKKCAARHFRRGSSSAICSHARSLAAQGSAASSKKDFDSLHSVAAPSLVLCSSCSFLVDESARAPGSVPSTRSRTKCSTTGGVRDVFFFSFSMLFPLPVDVVRRQRWCAPFLLLDPDQENSRDTSLFPVLSPPLPLARNRTTTTTTKKLLKNFRKQKSASASPPSASSSPSSASPSSSTAGCWRWATCCS